MCDFTLRVALPTSHVPKKILRVLKETKQQLYVYFYQEDQAFKAKAGPRKKDSYMETPFWVIISTSPVENYERRKWNGP